MAKRIFVVDDSKTMRDMIQHTLVGAGHQVSLAEDGVQALELLDQAAVDVIITDINMPRMDGISLVKALRTHSVHRGTPILILTTESDPAKKQEGKTAGATGWLVKPFVPEKLVDIVARVSP